MCQKNTSKHLVINIEMIYYKLINITCYLVIVDFFIIFILKLRIFIDFFLVMN